MDLFPILRWLRQSTVCTGSLFFALAVSGCAGSNKAAGPIFFPQAPNPPRVQYLTRIADSRDVEGDKSSFSLFASKKEEDDKVRQIGKPYGIASAKGKIYVCDVGGATVHVLDPVARTFEKLKGDFSVGKLKKPINIAVDSDGSTYVADVERKEILVYDPAGNFRLAMGKEYEMKPTDVAVDEKFIYVIDMNHSEIIVFDKDGKVRNRIGRGTENSEGLALPTNFALDGKGFIYVTNAMTGKVIKFDRDGHHLMSFGKLGDGFGEFGRPKGIAVDGLNRIYVADAAHQNVQIFNDKGRLLMFFGDPGTAPDGTMNLPASVAVTTENLAYYQKLADPSFELENVIFVANQYGPNKIAVYGLGHEKGKQTDSGDTEMKTEQPKSGKEK